MISIAGCGTMVLETRARRISNPPILYLIMEDITMANLRNVRKTYVTRTTTFSYKDKSYTMTDAKDAQENAAVEMFASMCGCKLEDVDWSTVTEENTYELTAAEFKAVARLMPLGAEVEDNG